MRQQTIESKSTPLRRALCISLALLCGSFVVACDTTATFSIQEIQIFPDNPMHVVSVTPVTKNGDGTYTPACSPGQAINGFRMDFVIQSTQHVGNLQGNNDTFVRAGDYVGGTYVTVGPGGTISKDSLQFGASNNLDQAEPLNTGSGAGIPNATASPSILDYTPHNQSRNQPIAVAVLMDHSASMIGSVDPFFKHETKIQVGSPQIATDINRDRFSKGGAHLIEKLNPKDKLIAWTFSEDGLVLACSNEAIATMTNETQREQACFGTTHEYVYNPSANVGLGQSFGAFDLHSQASGEVLNPNGRTPLWEAVNHAWDFLQTEAPDLPKHIIVVTDSPDTCSQEGPWFVPDQECTQTPVSYSTFKNQKLAVNPDIPVSFIQIQSVGYTTPDAAQMETACMTGGTYQWINRLDFGTTTDDLGNALTEAYRNVRGTLGGVWNLYVDMNVAGLPAGELIALSGTVKLEAPELVVQSYTDDFRNLSIQDDRLLLRQTCSADSECGGTDGDCSMECVSEGNMCAGSGGAPRLSEGDCCCGDPVDPANTTFICNAYQEPCCVKDPGDVSLINTKCGL